MNKERNSTCLYFFSSKTVLIIARVAVTIFMLIIESQSVIESQSDNQCWNYHAADNLVQNLSKYNNWQMKYRQEYWCKLKIE